MLSVPAMTRPGLLKMPVPRRATVSDWGRGPAGNQLGERIREGQGRLTHYMVDDQAGEGDVAEAKLPLGRLGQDLIGVIRLVLQLVEEFWRVPPWLEPLRREINA